MDGRRWDTDERGHGVGPGDAFSPNVQELADALPGSGWVAEEPEAHLLPHLQAACDEPGSRWTVTHWTVDDGVFVVDASWTGSWGTWDALRGDAFAFLGRIAELTTHIPAGYRTASCSRWRRERWPTGRHSFLTAI
jgi:hypothetical protein